MGPSSAATGGGSFILRVNTDQLRINFEQSSNYTQFNTTIALARWYHVVATYDGGTSASGRKLFIDGVEIAQTSTVGTITGVNLAANPDFAVAMRTDISGYINGYISQFKLYDTALTASEVKTLYDMGRCSNAIPKTLHIMGGMMRYNNDINRLQIHNGVQWSTIGGISATGGTVTNADGYNIHTFTSSGTLIVQSPGQVEYLVVAGGGGGATQADSNNRGGGGGGAGGMLTGTFAVIPPGSYTITVGAGGSRASTPYYSVGTSGSNSIFSTITATGGGRGGAGNGQAPSTGGSGGGGGSGATPGAGASGISGQGFRGGNGVANSGGASGGAGGGAGGVGGHAIAGVTAQNPGGIGVASSISGSSVTYSMGGASGVSGGNISASYKTRSGNTGDGGNSGGGLTTNANTRPAPGADGIVIIRYLR